MGNKYCKSCFNVLDPSMFYKSSRNSDGLSFQCKICERKRKNEFFKSIDGVVCAIYKGQRERNRKMGFGDMVYSKDELSEWLLSQPSFYLFYSIWVYFGYDKHLKPSCDRIDDYGGYTLDNIQLMTWGENLRKSHKDRYNCINNKVSKPVVNKLNGVIVGAYQSIRSASRATGVPSSNIICAIDGRYKMAGGYEWERV